MNLLEEALDSFGHCSNRNVSSEVAWIEFLNGNYSTALDRILVCDNWSALEFYRLARIKIALASDKST